MTIENTETKTESFHLKHFISDKYFVVAKKILDEQVKCNRRNYKTTQFEFFNINESRNINVEETKKEIFYNQFYGLSSEYLILNYESEKGIIGFRNTKFFSYKMLLLYYTIGFYLYDLSVNITKYKKSLKNTNTFYGNKIQENTFLENSNIAQLDYIKSRKSFNFKFDKLVEFQEGKIKYVISIDIKDFFDSINIGKLLTMLDKYCNPQKKQELNYDESTKDSIKNLFKYISDKGIPQSDNNIISQFLADLYLFRFDSFVSELINEKYGKNAYYLRYMDDIKIIVSLNEGELINPYNLLKLIEIKLYSLVNLNINTKKFKIDIIKDEKTYQIATENIHLMSMFEDRSFFFGKEVIEKSEIDPIIESIITSIGNISKYNKDQITMMEQDFFSIKKLFMYPEVIGKIEEKSNLERLNKAFNNFDFNFVSESIKEINVLICKIPKVLERYIDYYLQGDIINTKLKAIEHLLIQKEPRNDCKEKTELLLEKLSTQKNEFSKIMALTFKKEKYLFKSEFDMKKYQSLLDSNSIEQIKYLFISLKETNYNSSLNHLLNLIQRIAFKIKPSSNFDANSCISTLQENNVPSDLIIRIENLFVRRNNNPISHSGGLKEIPRSVSKKEYYEYEKIVKRTIEYLSAKNT